MRQFRTRPITILGLLLTLALVAAACGDSDSDSSSATTTSSAETTTASSDTTEAAGAATTTAAADGGGTVDYASLSGEINGSGASYPDACYQASIAAFADVAPDLSVTYNSIGSGSGKEEFGNNLNDWAGSDSLVKEGDGPEAGSFFYIPSTASSITAAYNLPSVDVLNLSGPVLAQIFQAQVTTWNDPAIADLNPDVELPDTSITIAVRSDGSGTTSNFTKYLVDAAPDDWTLGTDDVVEWPASAVGGAQNTGVAQIVQDTEGAIGYVDLGDAGILGLQTALIQNADGNFVAPSVQAATDALAGAELSEDLTYNPLNGPGADAYPITAPTYILVRTTYDSQELRDNVVGWVDWLISEGVAANCPDVGFAPVPDSFVEAGQAQLEKVTVG
jgi:phosphate transport system substrate-binding protein